MVEPRSNPTLAGHALMEFVYERITVRPVTEAND